MTCLDGEHVQIFPVSEWENVTFAGNESRLRNSEARAFFLKANRWGSMGEIDGRGRILIHKELRDKTNLKDDVVIEGRKNHLVLKNALSCDRREWWPDFPWPPGSRKSGQ